ncbi:MAG: hypothetical protein K0S32_836 [Bacteroidetes bacterium]|nr:hypothetical protein [Bacteroidota bacterium]
MKKVLFSFLLFLSVWSYATHNRAGEILYKRIAPFTAVVGGVTVQVYTYSFTVIRYTDDSELTNGSGIADRCVDTLDFGDGTKGVAPRVNGLTGLCSCGSEPCGEMVIVENGYNVKKNVYTIIHTYSGPGSFLVKSFDPNRNEGVVNIPNSVNQPFYIESLLIINAFTGANTSPTFKFDPTDKACLGKCFYHNPGAFDIDGDSLSYQITQSKGINGAPVPGYTYPDPGPGGTFGIDAITGTVKWCTPQFIGEYNIAFYVFEWRKNTSGKYQLIGRVLRDMQVIVRSCPNTNEPLVIFPADTCVEAGTNVQKQIIVQDLDNNNVVITGAGGAFNAPAPSAVLNPTIGAANPTYTTNFSWQTTCTHIRQQPYISIFKAEDQPGSGVPKLVFFGNYNITVVPPTVKNVSATPVGTSIKLTWSASVCNPTNNPLIGYLVYRKNDCSPFVFDPCKTGVDPTSGYTKLGQTTPAVTSFTDTGSGNGLVVGQDYSYIVVSLYKDGSQSFSGSQVCAKLKRDVPVLLNDDILSTSAATGSVYIRWTRPLTTSGNFDPNLFPGPYQFNLKHRAGPTGTFTNVFNSTQNTVLALDTEYYHINLNTIASDHEYIVEFIAGTVTIGSSQRATSVFLNATGNDRKIDLAWASTTPWNNYKYTVFRKDPGSSTFTAVATTSLTSYQDTTAVKNHTTYCYRILSEGKYSDPSIYSPLLNNSQEVCATAIDLVPPCIPTITITANCPNGYVNVSWNNVSLSCSDDVVKYVLYQKKTVDDEYVKIDTLFGAGNTSYTFDGLTEISSCFAIKAVDWTGNASALSGDYCIDNCPEFELPNIFTLNGDGVNDFFKAIKVRQIKEIDLYIFDRWGNLIYKTKDPYFKWDGVSIITNKTVSEGTFFYICDVYEPRVSGIKKRNLKGYVQVVK